MDFLIARCPTTQLPLDSKIESDIDSLARNWTKTVRVPCPYCGSRHEIKVRDAVFDSQREREDIDGPVAREA
jgi:DNA-directed RNA polymerase subunit RPC12/RpoP